MLQQKSPVERGTESAMSGVAGDGEAAMSQARPRVSLAMVADLLGNFDGVTGDFDVWKKQVRFLKTAYCLEDDHAKILIGMRLKRRALEWLHSRPEYISMSFEALVRELRAMFRRHESKLTLRRKFENRIWKKEEAFLDYLHEKTILGNRVPIDEEELLEQIVDGIPDHAARSGTCTGVFVSGRSVKSIRKGKVT